MLKPSIRAPLAIAQAPLLIMCASVMTTGELAVVGVLLEDECPPASSGRYRQQWCSALQQAMDLMPEEIGAVSGTH